MLYQNSRPPSSHVKEYEKSILSNDSEIINPALLFANDTKWFLTQLYPGFEKSTCSQREIIFLLSHQHCEMSEDSVGIPSKGRNIKEQRKVTWGLGTETRGGGGEIIWDPRNTPNLSLDLGDSRSKSCPRLY